MTWRIEKKVFLQIICYVPSIFIYSCSFAKDMSEGIVRHSEEVEKKEVERAEGIKKQKLITSTEGSKNCYMRKFTMEEGGKMGSHRHQDTEHVQYVIRGEIKIFLGDEVYIAPEDSTVFIPAGTSHSYENVGDGEAEFLCIIPAGDVKTELLG